MTIRTKKTVTIKTAKKATSKKPKPGKVDIAKLVVDSLNESAPLVPPHAPEPPPQPAPVYPRRIDSSDSDDEQMGVPYIRLLNATGQVRPVTADAVADRLFDGYFFIVDEPAVPRLNGEPERCDGEVSPGFAIRPVLLARPDSYINALRMWLNRMQEDRQRFGDRKDLMWAYINHTRKKLNMIVENDGLETIFNKTQ